LKTEELKARVRGRPEARTAGVVIWPTAQEAVKKWAVMLSEAKHLHLSS
jgi:hypothetical protein